MGENAIMYEKHTYFLDDFTEIKKWRETNEMNVLQWVGMLALIIFNRGIRIFYNVFYFYFTPIFVVIIVQISDMKIY